MRTAMTTTFALLMTLTLLGGAAGCIGPEGEPPETVDETGDIVETQEIAPRLETTCEPRRYTGAIAVDTVAELESLRGVTAISDRLTIRFTELENLDGLECLESVGALYIEDNSRLVDLSGLSNLRRVNGRVVIRDNGQLPDCAGLDNLESIAGGFEIHRNPSLESAEGLGNLISIGGDLIVTRNAHLRSLAGFESLERVGFDLYVIGNNNLSVLGFDALRSVGSGVYITDNQSLSGCAAEELANEISGVSAESVDVMIEGNLTCE